MSTVTTMQNSALRRLSVIELKLFLRERVGPVFGVGFPMLLLVIFGSIPSFQQPNPDFGGLTELDVYVPVLIAFMLAILSLSALPSTLAVYREKGILRRVRTTPVGPVRVLGAQLVVNLGVAAVTVIALLVVARFGYGVVLPRQWAGFVIAVVLAAAALMAVGLFVAAVAPTGGAAQAIGTILFFPMMFLAGLWLPIAQMPSVLRDISRGSPLGAAVQALQDADQGHWPHLFQLVVLVAYAVVFGLAAARLFRWE